MIEQGGCVIQDNVIYNDATPNNLKYVFVEFSGNGATQTEPNTYRNNTIIGLGATSRSFYIDSSVTHQIIGNTGLTESTIQNSLTAGVALGSPISLLSTDSVWGNYKATGDPTPNSTTVIPNIYGSTSASGTLTLASTSNATKGKILLGASSAYDEVNTRLGIGGTSPIDKLHIAGTTPGLVIEDTGNKRGKIYTNNTKLILGEANVSDILTIDMTNLRVGIGTTSPGAVLSLSAALGDKLQLYNGANYGFGVQNGLTQIYSPTSTDRVGIGYGSSASFTETLSVKGARVGVNNSSPGTALDVTGTVTATLFSGSGASLTSIPLTTAVTGTLPVANGGTGVTTSTGTGNVVLSASPTLSGTIGWGSVPSANKINLYSTTYGIGIDATDLVLYANNNAAVGISFKQDSYNGTTMMRIKTDGTVGIGTTSPTNLLSLGGNSARTIWMERHTTSNTAGNSLTIQAGGATSAATDKAGGDLILAPGLSTGIGSGKVRIQAPTTATSTGISDNPLVDRLVVTSSKALTDAATSLFEISLATLKMAGDLIMWTHRSLRRYRHAGLLWHNDFRGLRN
jgi:hypothetical protein